MNVIKDETLKAGENFTVLCRADGIPVPMVTWTRKMGKDSMKVSVASKVLIKLKVLGYLKCSDFL